MKVKNIEKKIARKNEKKYNKKWIINENKLNKKN